MQVLHRNGEDREDRDKRAALGAGSTAFEQPDPEENIIVDDELEIRASHITAAAVAAAAVTAAVTTAAVEAHAVPLESKAPPQPAVTPRPARVAAPEPELPPLGYDTPTAAVPQLQPQPQTQVHPDHIIPAAAAATPRAELAITLLTLAALAAAWWSSPQLPWPQRSLKPIVQHLPSLRKPASPMQPLAPAALAAVAPQEETAPIRDTIAVLQAEAEDKAHLLAQHRAAVEQRQRREDAAQARRDQRRREAEAQLAAARAKAERLQGAAPAEPEVAEASPAPTLAEQLQQCSAQSLFARERCLWKLCNGNWGKNGCPSYERNAEGA